MNKCITFDAKVMPIFFHLLEINKLLTYLGHANYSYFVSVSQILVRTFS